MVCWLGTQRPQKWHSLLWACIFFSHCRSSESLWFRPQARTQLYFSSFTSFYLFNNQSGTLYWCGFCIMVITRSTSSSVSSPVLLVDICFLQHHMSRSSPHTLNCCDGKGSFPLPINIAVEYSQTVLELLRDHQWQRVGFFGSINVFLNSSVSKCKCIV